MLFSGISVGIGVVCGLITLLVRYVGIFLQGFFLGAILAFTGKDMPWNKFFVPRYELNYSTLNKCLMRFP